MIAPTTPSDTVAIAPTTASGWFAQFSRLVRWELFLAIRRRAMIITLSVLLLVGYLLVLLVDFAIYESGPNDPTIASIGSALSFPGSISVSGGFIANAGVLLFVVLVGALIGSEYSYSTLRLSLARGVGRGQLLAAQITAVAIFALSLTAVAIALGALAGGFGQLLGISSPATLAGLSIGELLAYWLALAYNLFAYALIAVCLGTLTRSVAGGIAGPLVFIVIEVVVTSVLTALALVPIESPLLKLIVQTPAYLMGVNTGALITLAGAEPYPLTIGAVSNPTLTVPHSLIVSAIYCVLFILSSYLVLRSRDIVE
jgi:ABC-type transport system involved in multi-copper enzyme maturation permease subunit